MNHNYYMNMLPAIASGSRDISTKAGALIVGPDGEIRSTGFNGFPRGVNDDLTERYNRPLKYKWTEHAERNAIYHAARFGTSCKGCTLYCTHWPCSDCTRGIIQAGIVCIVTNKVIPNDFKDRWAEDIIVSEQMIQEAKVRLILI